ncbi:MAG: cytochrome P450 [Nannocystaceae bacterium]
MSARTRKRLQIPGPEPTPLLGNLPRFRGHGLLAPYLGDWRRYGDILRYKLGPREVVALCHPEQLRHIFIKERARYAKGMSVRNVVPLIGGGLFAADGDAWQGQRRLLHRLFTTKAVRAHEAAMMAAIDALIDRWLALPPGATIELLPEMSHLAMDVICRTMFGMAADAGARELGEAVSEAFSWVGEEGLKLVQLPLSVPTPRNRRFNRAKARIDRFLKVMIDERRARGPRGDAGDLLDLLLEARDDESGAGMSDAQVADEVVTVFIAGHETTAVSLTWAWLLLAGHRDVEVRLHDELELALGGQPPTVADLAALPYTRQLLDETLRHFPPVWIDPRQAIADDTIDGYAIPAGTLLMPVLYATHRHPDFWDDPERFDPDRFAPELAKARHPLAHVPFGGGPRVCLGMPFAYQEMILAVAAIAQRFRLRRAYGTLLDFDALAGTLRPRWPTLVELVRRER